MSSNLTYPSRICILFFELSRITVSVSYRILSDLVSVSMLHNNIVRQIQTNVP